MSVASFPITRRRDFGKIARTVLVASLATALSGCYTAQTRDKSADLVPTDHRKRHPIAIREGERALEILIGTSRDGLTPSQRAEILAFAQSWKREATGGVNIDLPSGTANEIAASQTLREIRSILIAAGIPARGVNVRPYRPADDNNLATLKIGYSKFVAEAGPCGLWPQDIGPSMERAYFQNRPYWNLGCANQRNLAAMVDNPADLVQPRGEAPSYTARRSVAIDKYRKGEDPSGKYDTHYDTGKISGLGK